MSTSKSNKYGLAESIFVWSATYFDISKVNNEKCIICGNNAISTFPILPNEEFTFNYDEKHGVELEFGIKKDKNKK
jgi:hypothetical protein